MQEISRRRALTGVGSVLLCLPTCCGQAASASVKRVVVLDWTVTEVCLSIGLVPVGATDTVGYNRWVADPALPSSVVNLGNRFQPNIELVVDLEPDLILTSSFFVDAMPALDAIAPVEIIDIFSPNRQPLRNAEKAAKAIGMLSGRRAEAEASLQRSRDQIRAVASRMNRKFRPPVVLATFYDSRHLRVYGRSSMLQSVLDALNVENAWQGATNYWGFGTIGFDQLAAFEDAVLIGIKPIPDVLTTALGSSPIWRRMPMVARYGFHEMEPISTFGGLYAAARFALQLEIVFDEAEART